MKKYISIVVIFFTVGIAGCKKDYLSLEVNPNNPSVASPQLLLAGALETAVSITNAAYPQDGVWVAYWTPSGNYVPSSTLQQFQITNTTYTGVWSGLYANLTNFNSLQVTAAKDPSLANFQAIAMIMKAYDFQQLVDQFGDVPYSQAFQPSTILFPAYDSAQAIYNDLVKQLDAAIALINAHASAASPGSSDIVFAGTMTGWKKFANTLKLRLAIRQSTKNLGNAAAAALAATASEGYFDQSTQAAAQPPYSNSLSVGNSQQSPFYAAFGFDTNGNPTFGNTYYRANNVFVNDLKAKNDPRLQAIYAPTDVGGAYQGNNFGDTKTTLSNPNTSAVGPGLLKSPVQNAVFFSGAEGLFLQAEALLDGYAITAGASFPSAQQCYEAGITASFTALGLTAAQATTYYSQNIVNVGWTASAADQKQAIVYQKWTSLVGYENLEGYLEYLRTGFPVLPNPVSIDPASVSKVIPVRQFYPQSEVNTNNTNLAKEGSINIFTSKIFWEK